MKLSEVRLKQIIREEVEKRLLEIYENQATILLEEEVIEEGWKSRVVGALVGIGLALGAGALKSQVDAKAQQASDRITANVESAAEYKATDEGITSGIEKQLNNTVAYLWSWSPDPQDATTLPLTDSGAGILPPEFSVMKQVLDDYKSGRGPAYNVEDVVTPSGNSEQNRLNFKDDFSGKDFKSWGGSRGVKGSIYPYIDDIEENYALPTSGKSKSERYVELWDYWVNNPLERVEKD